ncbi:MAG: (2Fe-2S) ferredoxin domain-containing protein [Planctomycetota bacterium]|jgi:NADP-reducing hydrogenase subunit HndB
MKGIINLREGAGRAKVIVHMGTCGIAAGARAVMTALLEEIETRDLKDVLLNISSCAGLCSREPMMTVELQDEPSVKYVDLTPDKARDILEKHVLGGQIIKEYALAVGEEKAL